MMVKLKRNFIFTNMIIVSIILITIFLYLYFSSANDMEIESYKKLDVAMDRFNITKNYPRGNGLALFSFKVSSTGEVMDIEGENFLNNEELSEVAQQVSLSDNYKGEISDLNIRYLVDVDSADTRFFIIDISYEKNMLFSLIVRLIFICIIAHIVFFIVSIYLSKMVVNPAKKAWQNQQQFISDASHELKTPLTIILANIELLFESNKNNINNTKRINYVMQEANRMKKLVEQLLFLARSDEYSEKVEYKTCNISEVIEESILMFEPIAFENKIDLSYDIEEDIRMPCVKAQMKQLHDILVDNAIKYTPGGEAINIRLYRHRNQVKLEINNSGTYLSEIDISNIFDRFYKEDKVRSNNKNSYGLGLSIAKKICDGHKGTIRAASNKKDGTTFIVEI